MSPGGRAKAASAADPGTGPGTSPRDWEQALEGALQRHLPARWLGWRRRALVVVAVAAALALFALIHTLAALPALPGSWRVGPAGGLILSASADPALDPARGKTLLGFSAPGGAPRALDGAVLHLSARWQVSDAERAQRLRQLGELQALWAAGPVALHFADGAPLLVQAQPRGVWGLGAFFWLWAGLALALALLGAVLALARPDARNLLFLVLCLAQAGQLVFMAAHPFPRLGAVWCAELEGPLRAGLDAVTAAASLAVLVVAAPAAAGSRWLLAAAWAAAASLAAAALAGRLPGLWWATQSLFAVLVALAWWVAARGYRTEPDPFLVVMKRMMGALLAVWCLITLTVAVGARLPEAGVGTAGLASSLWTLFAASLLLLTPFISRSRQMLREFALLAGVSTVATSLDLLFAALFALGPFSSLALAVFLALGVYAGVRQWLLNQMLTSQVLTTERTFEQIHRVAREVQGQPHTYAARAAQLLRDLFDPMEVLTLRRAVQSARILGNGSALVVPVVTPDETEVQCMVLRFAQRGRRLFSPEDARLAERVVDQLRRAVAYDRAVERGRKEERQRIAQDLHDDIGARLLTLMYQAPTPEMEDYIRHTLKDLKTLSRGLAAGELRFSLAAAEWKADLTQRTNAARVQLRWQLEADADPLLGVVPWSAVTRVLRELVSNALAHANATHLDVRIALAGGELSLRVADDGGGRNPQAWSHGLGLGGVRKRVKLLGGEVQWRENQPVGIACEVRLPGFAAN